MRQLKKILMVRNDKLGDFMLAYPSFALLKSSLPEVEIHALVPRYTQAMAEACPWIDAVIVDPGKKSGFSAFVALLRKVKNERYDAVITLFSTTRVGWLVRLAGIPYRLAPATKIAQLFYNHRLIQRRSRSEKPEFEYNLDLMRALFRDFQISESKDVAPPYLTFDSTEILRLRERFCVEHRIPMQNRIAFVHPGSGGSANNLSLKQYSDLADRLTRIDRVSVVVTAGPSERAIAQQVVDELRGKGVSIGLYVSTDGLLNFAKHIAFADLFTCGSTGPLHIAGALNRSTAAFYPRSRVMSSLRWQTLNEKAHRLAFFPPESVGETDMQNIDLADCVMEIRKLLS